MLTYLYTRGDVKRVTFRMKCRIDKIDEYIKEHKNVDELLKNEFEKAGVSNYDIYLDRETGYLFGIVDLSNFDYWLQIPKTKACQLWWDKMQPLMEVNAEGSPISVDLDEVFNYSKEVKIGIRGHDLKCSTITNLNSYGAPLQLAPIKLQEFNEHPVLTKDMFLKLQEELTCQVHLLGSYFNPVHSDLNVVNLGIKNYKFALENASLVNTNLVATETGSYNDNAWTYNPKNHTVEAVEQVASVFSQVIDVAVKNDSYLCIEPAYEHVIHDVASTKHFIKLLNTDRVKLIFDWYNILPLHEIVQPKLYLYEFLIEFKDIIKVVHLKDFTIENGSKVQCQIGDGIVDYKWLLETIKSIVGDVEYVLEEVHYNHLDLAKKLVLENKGVS